MKMGNTGNDATSICVVVPYKKMVVSVQWLGVLIHTHAYL